MSDVLFSLRVVVFQRGLGCVLRVWEVTDSLGGALNSSWRGAEPELRVTVRSFSGL